jgi:Ca2+-binding RTX toxin-like protein
VITVDGNVVAVYDPTSLGDGEHTVAIVDTDAAGNTSNASLTFTLDTTVPPPTGLDLATADDTFGPNGTDSDNLTKNTSNLTISGNAEAGATLVLFDDVNHDGIIDAGETLGTTTVLGDGTFSLDVSLAEGDHKIKAVQTDAAGNVSDPSDALGVAVDTTPPAVSITGYADDTAPTGDGKTTDTTLAISGSAAAGTVVTVKDGTTVLGTATANVSGVWTFNTTTLALGGHSFTASATDAAGNAGTSGALAVTVEAANDPNDFDNIIAGTNGSGSGTSGPDTIYGSNNPLVSDNIDGNQGNDLIYGRAGNDTLTGNTGDDTIYGGSGNDTISGNGGLDNLYGGSGNDTIIGNTDDDEIIGGFGADTLTGSGGNDAFRFWSVADGGDTIVDFGTGNNDNDHFEFRLPWSDGTFSGGFSLANQLIPTSTPTLVQVTAAPGGGVGPASIAGADVIVFSATNKTLVDSAAEIDQVLAAANGTFDGGVIIAAYDASGHVALYYDADANSIGGVTLLGSISNMTSTASLGQNDFMFIP